MTIINILLTLFMLALIIWLLCESPWERLHDNS